MRFTSPRLYWFCTVPVSYAWACHTVSSSFDRGASANEQFANLDMTPFDAISGTRLKRNRETQRDISAIALVANVGLFTVMATARPRYSSRFL